MFSHDNVRSRVVLEYLTGLGAGKNARRRATRFTFNSDFFVVPTQVADGTVCSTKKPLTHTIAPPLVSDGGLSAPSFPIAQKRFPLLVVKELDMRYLLRDLLTFGTGKAERSHLRTRRQTENSRQVSV